MRKLGIDFGDKRIGIAMSDPTNLIASPTEIYFRKHYKIDVEYISNLAKLNDVDVVVFGLPINMNGTRGDRVDKTEEFANSIKEMSNCKIEYIDERMTSVQAEKMLVSDNRKLIERQKNIDKICAAIILQVYLDKNLRR